MHFVPPPISNSGDFLSNIPIQEIKPPQYLILETTTECNLKCKQCHQWMTKEGPNALSTNEKLRAVRELHALNPQGRIILTGGETMQKYDEFMSISRLARELKMDVIANTNGSYLNENNLMEVLTYGPNFLLFSLDSHVEKWHRFLRGNNLNYGHLIDIIPKAVNLRNEQRLSTFIFTHSILFEENLSLWEDYIEFARNELKVDAVHFQLLKETLRNQNDKDPFFEKHFFKDIEFADRIIQKVQNKYAQDSFMGMKTYDLELLRKELHNPQEIELGICQSAEKNIYIDSYGWVGLCLHMHEIMPKESLGHYTQTNLNELWTSEQANNARQIMRSCSKNCGMLNCHRKTSHDNV